MDYSLLLVIEETKEVSGAKMSINDVYFFDRERNVIESNSESTGINKCYHMGIIDYLQDWSSGKKREYRIKKWIHTSDPNGISCVEPELYKDRFVKFICEDVLKQCWMSKQ